MQTTFKLDWMTEFGNLGIQLLKSSFVAVLLLINGIGTKSGNLWIQMQLETFILFFILVISFLVLVDHKIENNTVL